MIVRTPLAAVLALTLSAACATAQPAPGGGAATSPASPPSQVHGKAIFSAADGSERGAAVLTAGPAGVLVLLELRGLTPGWHAVHFHARGDCSDPKFESAGSHINHATPAPHGLLNPKGPDFGDLPNIWADDSGTARAQLFSSFVSLKGEGGRSALLDADGSAIVVHASPDDYVSQPIGGAGARVACAVMR